MVRVSLMLGETSDWWPARDPLAVSGYETGSLPLEIFADAPRLDDATFEGLSSCVVYSTVIGIVFLLN